MERQRNGERKRNKKNTQKGGGCDSQQTWTLKSEMRGGGVAGGTKPCLHNRTSRKEKVFQSSFEPVRPAVQRHRLCFLPFTGHSLLFKGQV